MKHGDVKSNTYIDIRKERNKEVLYLKLMIM